MTLPFKEVQPNNTKIVNDTCFSVNPYHDRNFEWVIHSWFMNEYLKYFTMSKVLRWLEDGFFDDFEEKYPDLITRVDDYTWYYFPDFGEDDAIIDKVWERIKDLSYWVAIVSKWWDQHWHESWKSYNKILSGSGTFVWSNTDYHWGILVPWTEIEISENMLHGHKVEWKDPLVFFFVQECGFFKWNICEWDFFPYSKCFENVDAL